ncbi:DUF2336 domain-containing protein [Devosia sp. 63-57]|uniref:DUF2336 domain-containing protein n=1 Tax=Devosia sp. 63-57 TaxID=1895751 RepID=UPI00086979D2|nr:DUF2336 domain-containing protein [Devosia sp. 63-57]ODT49804.1 MAG: hypothetical protein ABS74_06310 [Pelagibacterium sp. SCN 63-126]ODU86236.1 MAG: hypothetical protein ABT14_09470 [Pelagibacterium sp. SCN 63-17]OJX45179.1 MAG: hypothetical protein BGO80_04960 [Devosia sp. 63-57]
MIGYQAFADLSQSSDSDERGHAAHLAALAYLKHDGPADEHAALYAALISFLDDPSVKVRASLAYGLLHSLDAPRPIILALLRDSPIISRAVLQYSPILVDADLMSVVRNGDIAALVSIAQRTTISPRIGAALIARNDDSLTLRVLRRKEVQLAADVLQALANTRGENAQMRGALLARKDLPAPARLLLVQRATESLRQCRMVKGALAPDRLERLLRDGNDTAVSAIGERASVAADPNFVEQLVGANQLNTRLLLHAVVTGHVMFFAACLANLAQVSRDKVFSLLESGSRPALMALFVRCGLDSGISRLLVRLVLHARAADLADDVAARHYVVTALTEEMIADYDGDIPPELEEAFAYLGEQNIALARKAARGVMAAFAGSSSAVMSLPPAQVQPALALPAA